MATTNAPPQMRTLRIIHFAMVVASLLYVVIAQVVSTAPVPALGEALPVLLGVMALIAAVTSLVIPQMLLRRALETMTAELIEGGVRPAFADPAQAWKDYFTRAFPLKIVAFAQCEAIAVLGLVVKMLGGSWLVAGPFFVLSWVLFALHAPRLTVFQRELEGRFEASLPAA